MESHTKSATVENNLYDASYYIIQKNKIAQRYARQSKTLEARVPGVCVGLSMTLTIFSFPFACTFFYFELY